MGSCIKSCVDIKTKDKDEISSYHNSDHIDQLLQS